MAADLIIILEGQLETSEDLLQSGGSDYTVPAGRELVIKEIRLVNDADTDYYAYLKIGDGSAKTTIWPQKDITARDGYRQDCNTVVKAGKSVYAKGENATGLWVYLTCLERDA
jgi:hypothetical protein